jgi:ribonuclease E
MSGEANLVGAARRAFIALGSPVAALVGDFAAAEEGAAALEPELALLSVDLFGSLTVPVGAVRAENARRARRAALSPLERLAAAARLPPTAESANAAPRGGGAAAAAGTARRGVDAPPLPPGTATVAPVFRLAGPVAQARTSSREAAALEETRTRAAAEPGGAPGAAAELLAAAPVVGSAAAGAAVGTVELIAQLTESILAATAKTGAAGGADTASRTAGAGSRPVAEPGRASGAEPAFLTETLRSLGGETAAAFGLEPGTAEARRDDVAGEDSARAAPPAAPGAPAAARPAGPELAAPAPAAPSVGIVPRPAENDADPAALAALVNDALVEQARRHGLELG